MRLISMLALVLCVACTRAPGKAPAAASSVSGLDSVPTPAFPKPARPYPASRNYLDEQRRRCQAAFSAGQLDLDSVGRVFTRHFLAEIIPHWYGTAWSFYGHTELPGQGNIACGYFVSTTLLHAGLRLNRYRLAQAGPADEALMLSLGDTVRVYRGGAAAALERWRSQLREGLYFVGLGGSHVGFLLHQAGRLYLLHSNYVGPVAVQLQPVEESVLMGFQEFYLADITYNRRLMEHWLGGKNIKLEKNGALKDW